MVSIAVGIQCSVLHLFLSLHHLIQYLIHIQNFVYSKITFYCLLFILQAFREQKKCVTSTAQPNNVIYNQHSASCCICYLSLSTGEVGLEIFTLQLKLRQCDVFIDLLEWYRGLKKIYIFLKNIKLKKYLIHKILRKTETSVQIFDNGHMVNCSAWGVLQCT